MRNKKFKCTHCGQFIAYNDIGTKVISNYTPDTHFTTEVTSFTHQKCLTNELIKE